MDLYQQISLSCRYIKFEANQNSIKSNSVLPIEDRFVTKCLVAEKNKACEI